MYAARFEHLRTRADNPLKGGQARAAIAAALLRQLFVVVTRRVAWNPAIAAVTEEAPIAALRHTGGGRGEPGLPLGRTRD